MPERVSPFAGTGGKLEGILKTEFGTPWSSRICQNALPCLSCSALPLPSGTTHFPSEIECFGGSTRDAEKYSSIVLGSRWMKSKMPWPPAFIPVIRLDHATGLCGGIAVVSGLNEPMAASLAKFGI